jgi:hypothetical protein
MALTVDGFCDAFGTLGYTRTSGAEFDPALEKVAIYVDAVGEPCHMARQLSSGSWTSKLGNLEDIEHADLAALEGALYGTVAVILARPRGKPLTAAKTP